MHGLLHAIKNRFEIFHLREILELRIMKTRTVYPLALKEAQETVGIY
jgi:hypothetical protein